MKIAFFRFLNRKYLRKYKEQINVHNVVTCSLAFMARSVIGSWQEAQVIVSAILNTILDHSET